MTIQQYIETIAQRYKLGNATEHTFRGDLQMLIESIVPEIQATNEPKRQSCGAPDYILTKKEIPIGFIEAKDIGDKDLEGVKKTGNKEQFDRYKASLNNLIFTDYLRFYVYRDGQLITHIAIGEITEKGIQALPQNFSAFTNILKDFCTHIGQNIKSSKRLAQMMAAKARLLSDIIEKALTSDETNKEDSTLKDQMNAFRQILIHDITPKGFADVYAQTIAYGMFAARLHDATLPTFSRQEAAELIPKSNPFLRKLFGYIAGPDIDDRITWVVDSLVEIFLACNVEEILKNYGKSTKMEDPIIHFYETFLSEYDPKLRKARGVWYTPQPVVHFIVRAVDDILKTEFNMPQGLADTSKTKIKINLQATDNRYKDNIKTTEQEVHRVQILDPATGTGTFLAEVVKHIHKKFEGQQGIWSNYVETHLLPRLNGFELLMASYAMAHLKLDLLLSETGFNPTTSQRLRVYLTNSLEEHHPDTGTLFANWLSQEANEANHIKRDAPVMCILGNPPYSVSSTNKNEWIQNLIADYKKDLNEKNIQPLSDDYIKFIRYGQHFVDKNRSGVVAYISNNSFIDGIIHRQMRKHLLENFDTIYILDLHGNARKKEVCPDGSPDQNVFDIMQGVSINIFVKTGKKKANELGKVFHYDLFGKRELKYDFLSQNNLKTIAYKEVKTVAPNYFFVAKDFSEKKSYDLGFGVNELFEKWASGIKSERDSIAIQDTEKDMKHIFKELIELEIEDFRKKYTPKPDGRDWKIKTAKEDLKKNKSFITNILYRPFDIKKTTYTGKSKGFHSYPRNEIMQHMLRDNLAIMTCRQLSTFDFQHILISKYLVDMCTVSLQSKETTYAFPLYLYPETTTQLNFDQSTPKPSKGVELKRVPNLNPEIVQQIAEKLGLNFVTEKTTPLLYKEGLGVVESYNTDVVKNHNSTYSGGTERYSTVNNLPYLKTFRKELRNNLTPAEATFWTLVQNSKLEGRKFRRQHSVGNYILDFYCPSEKLAVELDGEVHATPEAQLRDEERTRFLNSYGITVLRFENRLVFEHPEYVLDVVSNGFKQTTPTPPYQGGEYKSTHPDNGEELGKEEVFAPIDILDYIYAVLHSPKYRKKYKEFLKIDFPRVPYPKDADSFWKLVKLGGEIRQIHLLESPMVEKYITQYPIDGDNMVAKPRYENGKVYINATQYFDNVPIVAWEFYIGGYQPAQKWLKDRKQRKLEFDDILHYQKIIVALSETDRLMKEIDEIIEV